MINVERISDGSGRVQIKGPFDCKWLIWKETALQLAKDLLKACGARMVVDLPDPLTVQTATEVLKKFDEPEVYSGMSLDEIQDAAGKLYEGTPDLCKEELALLIANLAVRVKEQTQEKPVVEDQKLFLHGSGKGHCIHKRGKEWFHLSGAEEALQLIDLLNKYIDEEQKLK